MSSIVPNRSLWSMPERGLTWQSHFPGVTVVAVLLVLIPAGWQPDEVFKVVAVVAILVLLVAIRVPALGGIPSAG